MSCPLWLRCRAIRVVVVALIVILAATSACSGDAPQVEAGRARAAVPVAGSSQIVVTLTNTGDRADRLVEASTPVALAVEIHVTEIVEQRASMRTVDQVDILPGDQVAFRPGGLHLMMVVPDESVVLGATFPLTFKFRHAEPVTVDVEVVPIDALMED